MSINPTVTEALDSLLAGLDSLRAERDDISAFQASRAVTMVDRADPMVRPARQSRSAEALDAARLLALLASSASDKGASADLAQSAGALLRRLLKQRSVLVPKIHDAAPGIRISPRVAVLLSRLPAGHACALEADPTRFLYLTPRDTAVAATSEQLVEIVRAAAPVGETAMPGPATAEMISVSLPRLPELERVVIHADHCLLGAGAESTPIAALAWLDHRLPDHAAMLGVVWLKSGEQMSLLARAPALEGL